MSVTEGEPVEDNLTAHEMLLAQFPSMEDLKAAVDDFSAPLPMRMRAVYYLRTIASPEAIVVLSKALLVRENTPLMRHELAYVLGQIQDAQACPVLEQILADETDDAMVRHESAEALGAIGDERALPLLERCSEDTMMEVSETCRIAADFMKWTLKKKSGESAGSAPLMCACMNPYNSHDPAPLDPEFDDMAVDSVGAVLIDGKEELLRRYSAMFALRNRGGEEAVRLLGAALVNDTSSALFRHEVAFVLGQMQHPAAIEALAESLQRTDEHSMVRHESAEALGAIEGSDEEWSRCEEVLKAHLTDYDPVVIESCVVALDAADYWSQMEKNGTAVDGVKGFASLKRQSEKVALRGHFNITTPTTCSMAAPPAPAVSIMLDTSTLVPP
jgi:deoxyhypusine monooxygenase